MLLGFNGKFYNQSYGGHAVTAYGVEYNQWRKDGVNYNGRILIYDSNFNGFNEDCCLYFNTTTYRWAIPEYQITSDNGGSINLVSNDLNLLNGKGYFGSNTYTSTDDYIAVLQSVATTANYSVQKINKSSSGTWNTSSSNSPDDVKIVYDFLDNDQQENSEFKIAIKDYNSAWQFSVDKTSNLDLDMSYKDSILSASADAGQSAKFSPDGFVEINAINSDFELGMVFNEGYYTLPWYKVSVDGHNSNIASMTQTDDGIVLYGDNLVNVSVYATSDDINTGVNFSTSAETVLIYDIDDYTIGIAIDEDGDGTFETDNPIAQTSKTGDLNNDNQIDSLDVLLMKKTIFGISSITGDLNQDGVTNILDLIILKKNLFN